MSSYSFQGRTRTWTPRNEEENVARFAPSSSRNSSSGRKQTSNGNLPPFAQQDTNCQLPPTAINDNNDQLTDLPKTPKTDNEKWSVQRLTSLLRLYGAHHCLWDIHDVDYRSRGMRRAALVDITAALGEGVLQAEVVKKINVLRATYRYERRRIKQRMRKGIGAQTKLKWFALADAFLRKVPKMADKQKRKGSNREEADSDSDLEDALVYTLDPEALLPLHEETEPSPSNWQIKTEPRELVTTTLGHDADQPPENGLKTALGNAPHRKWSIEDSLHFVRLLKDYPQLWQTNNDIQSSHSIQALERVAASLAMPVERVQKRVHTFQRTCDEEWARMQQNEHYRPPFVWWPLAECFMLNVLQAKATAAERPPFMPSQFSHFVDPNELPPPTPQQQDESPMTPLNPIPSVAAFQTDNDQDEDLEDLDGLLFNERRLAVNDNTTTTTTLTKLIWNGLDDDLLEGKWSLKHSVKFLRLYGAHRCLWDLLDPDYRSRELRSAAIEDIAAAMGHGLTGEYVAKKIKIFRITYMQHRKRMLAASKLGRQPDIQLRWFPLADSFLRPHIGLRCIREDEREMPQFDFQYVYANLNLIDPALLNDFRGKGTQNTIEIGGVVEVDGRAGQVAGAREE